MGAANKERVIDKRGFRPNVGIIIANSQGQVLWGRRIGGRNFWQFPQGGMHAGESPEQAMCRELNEEVGLTPEHIEIIACTKSWLHYKLPTRYIRRNEQPICIGQKQRWFLLRLIASDNAVQVDAHEEPEFDYWRWVNYWYPINAVVDFKRQVYREALTELVPKLMPKRKHHKTA